MTDICVKTLNGTFREKGVSVMADPQFLIFMKGGKKFKFPWKNVVCVITEDKN